MHAARFFGLFSLVLHPLGWKMTAGAAGAAGFTMTLIGIGLGFADLVRTTHPELVTINRPATRAPISSFVLFDIRFSYCEHRGCQPCKGGQRRHLMMLERYAEMLLVPTSAYFFV
jgi:hypothetical protein